MASKKQRVASYLRLSIPGMQMGGDIRKIIGTAIKQGWNQNQLLMAVYKSPSFKKRFPGILDVRGALIMSPSEYLQRERELKNVMKQYGLIPMHFDQPKDFAGLIQNGIDPQQLAHRLEMSQQLLKNNPEILAQIQRMTGGPSAKAALNGALAWLLSPKRGTEFFDQIVETAQMAVSFRQAGFQAGGKDFGAFLKGLYGRGITAQQANQAFAQAGPEWAQFKTLAARYGGGQVSDQEFAAALFAPNPQLEALRKSLVSQEQAQFRSTSSYAMAGGRGVSGLQTDEGEDR